MTDKDLKCSSLSSPKSMGFLPYLFPDSSSVAWALSNHLSRFPAGLSVSQMMRNLWCKIFSHTLLSKKGIQKGNKFSNSVAT